MSNDTVTISSFPHDGEAYIIKNFGLIRKNPSPNASVYLVEVYMESLSTGRKLTVETILTHLLVARIGSVWKNQKRISDYHSREIERFETKALHLSLDNTKTPTTMLLVKDKTAERKKIININELDKNESEVLSTFTVFHTSSGLQILIPSLEILLSAYTPDTHTILHDIVTLPIDDVVNKHVKDCTEGSRNTYAPICESNYAISTKFFLAYLSCNRRTRKNVSKIKSSLANNQIMRGGLRYTFLEVFPYHPDTFKVEVLGLYDKEKERFWVHQIRKYTLPSQHNIDIQDQEEKDKENKAHRETQKRFNNDEVVEDEPPLIDNVDAGRNAGKKYIKSNVEIGIPWSKIQNTHATPRRITTVSGVVDPIEPEAASASPLSGHSLSGPVAAVEHKSGANDRQKEHLQSLLNSITDLGEDVRFLTDNAERRSSITYCTLPKKKTFKNNNSRWAWYKNKKPRKLLVCEICLNDKFVYILDIQRKKNEAFSGIMFALNDSIDDTLLWKIRETISINQGRFGGNKGRKKFPVERHMIFRHYADQTTMGKKLHAMINDI